MSTGLLRHHLGRSQLGPQCDFSPAITCMPQLKLQAIFYAPGHSSAMINGKTVKTGDVYKGFRVTAITQTSATLVSATQTNVMTLEEQ